LWREGAGARIVGTMRTDAELLKAYAPRVTRLPSPSWPSGTGRCLRTCGRARDAHDAEEAPRRPSWCWRARRLARRPGTWRPGPRRGPARGGAVAARPAPAQAAGGVPWSSAARRPGGRRRGWRRRRPPGGHRRPGPGARSAAGGPEAGGDSPLPRGLDEREAAGVAGCRRARSRSGPASASPPARAAPPARMTVDSAGVIALLAPRLVRSF